MRAKKNASAVETDIFVSGGGMVGASLALALAQGGLRVTVVDPLPSEAATDAQFDGRVSALAYASTRMYAALGVWERLAPHAQPIRDILVTDARLGHAPSPFSLHFDHAEIGEPLGHIVENRHIRAALYAAIADAPNIDFLAPATAAALAIDDRAAVATLADGPSPLRSGFGRVGGREIRARLAVAADGRNSALREAMEIGTIAWSYPQWGIVTTVEHARPHNGAAYEHFLPSGPFAILPMTGNRSSLVWTERIERARAMMALPDADFAREIATRFGAHLGATQPVGPRWSYPLGFHLARGYVRPRFALAGDAAHGIHPIAGQGLNLGLKDAAALAEVVLDAARLGLDYGAADILARYERWRRFDSFALAAATDVLNRLFSNDVAPLRVLRDVGMGIVDRIAPLRRFFMRHAGGELGKLPRLLRGEAA